LKVAEQLGAVVHRERSRISCHAALDNAHAPFHEARRMKFTEAPSSTGNSAKPMDLQFSGPSLEMFSDARYHLCDALH